MQERLTNKQYEILNKLNNTEFELLPSNHRPEEYDFLLRKGLIKLSVYNQGVVKSVKYSITEDGRACINAYDREVEKFSKPLAISILALIISATSIVLSVIALVRG